MKRTAIIISMLLTMAGSALADNKLTASDLSLLPTEEREMAIGLASDLAITAFQFDLTLPAGVTLVTDSKSQPVISKDSRLDATHSVEAKPVSSGAWRFIGYSSKKAVISGTGGTLITLKVKASADAKPAGLKAVLSDIVMTKKDKTEAKLPDASGKVTIESPAVITIDNQSREYGNANPVLTYKLTGRLLKGEPILTTTAENTSDVGEYSIELDKSSVEGPYTVTKGTLTVTKAPLTVKAGTYTRKQGEENPEFTLSYDGFKNDETESVLTKKPTATTTATKESAVGDYPVTVSGAEAQNYDISYVSGTLTVSASDEPAVLPGDANNDGTVNVADIVETVNYMMGHPSGQFNMKGADANKDGTVNDADVIIITGIILKD